ncbi:hypothetical protein SAMN05444372_10853 [Flavobacterium micromati]|uniref:Uncharacterized protein n=1 Tax=Flavobacterium micromati TaxID=229205 RepID=A0A1M5LHJ0_9FLAO|nr:hypothetical protein [Flavobacterium micromati]SHG63843.1 hypothetical protein SAMN05444372_10853 [Flavobacterium micromati]
MTKKGDDLAVATSMIHRAVAELPGFEALLYRSKRNISVLGRSEIIGQKFNWQMKQKVG